MAEHARGSKILLTYLCLLLLLSSSAHLVMSMDLDSYDDYGSFSDEVVAPADYDNVDDESFADDRSFSDEAAPARRRLYDISLNASSSNRSGAAFCRLLSLQILDLSNNKLTGELPDCLWEMQALQFMDLSNNSFSGKIPEAPPSHNCSLESLHLAGNNFTGEFPTVVGGCQQLATVDIGNNRFYGDIPRWIGTFVPALKILRLSSNSFTGQIPPELSQLSQLQLLDLAHNGLTGLIPRELGDLASMKHPKINSSAGSLDGSIYQDRIDIIWKGQELTFQRILELMTGIDLSGNSLSHCIPEELTNLEGLRFLNLSRNHLSCEIPNSIGSLNVLESLDLSLNELSGAIPPGLSNMLSLNNLNLSNNNLSGAIPTGSQLQTLTDPSIYSNNPGLCGPPLNPCQDTPNAFDEGNAGECQDQWLYYCVIAGVVFGFWLWYGMLFSVAKLRCSVFLLADRVQYKIWQKVRPVNHFVSKDKSDPSSVPMFSTTDTS